MKNTLIAVACLAFSSAALASGWTASYTSDEMRGTASKYVELASQNSVNFDFPYNGGSKLTVLLRSQKTTLKAGQEAKDLPLSEALLSIDKGQISCHSFNDCHVSVKFDDGKILKYSMSRAADGSSDVIFFNNSSSFIKNLKTHKKMILEVEFFRAGNRQFKFDIQGLDSAK